MNQSNSQMMDINQMTDQEIVTAILRRDSQVTKEFLYKKCYPLFNRLFKDYYTDCNKCIELIDEIYLYLLYPGKTTHISKLEGFEYKCSLIGWIKKVSRNYCSQLYAKKQHLLTNSLDQDVIILPDEHSLEETTNNLDKEDLSIIFASMKNQTHVDMIKYRYIDNLPNDQIAVLVDRPYDDNFHTTMSRARKQFVAALKKEGLI